MKRFILYIRAKSEDKGWHEWRTPELDIGDTIVLSDDVGEKVEIRVLFPDAYAKAALPPPLLRPMKGAPNL